MNWYARMIYPYTLGEESNGYYDLQIVGTINFHGVTYTNPIFSYGSTNGVGTVSIFNRSISNAVYKDYLPFRGYHYNDTTSSSTTQYNAFIKLFLSCIDLNSRTKVTVYKKNGSVAGYLYRYNVTSSYSSYNEKYRNCFTAVGLWVSELGDNRFKNFAAKNDNTKYTAHEMLKNYSQYWDLQGTYTS